MSVALGNFVALCSFGDGSPGFSWFGVYFCWSWWPGWMCLCAFKLTFSWRYWECVLLGRSKWVGPHLGGMVPSVGMDPGEYCTCGFCNLTVNSGCALGPLEASALGGKTSSPYGKVRSLHLPKNPVWWRLMHTISSYRGNRPTNTPTNVQTHKQTHRQDRLQYTALLSLARSVITRPRPIFWSKVLS